MKLGINFSTILCKVINNIQLYSLKDTFKKIMKNKILFQINLKNNLIIILSLSK